jgi:GNAT superfamily N-acetyltransferase
MMDMHEDTKYVIRPATAADFAALGAIRETENASAGYWQQRIAAYARGDHSPQQALAPRVIFVAEDGGQIIGFIAGHFTRRYNCDGELQWIDTVPEHRRRGIAGKLLYALAAWFAIQGAKQVCVNCASDNIPAKTFYQKNGARPLNEFWLVWTDIGAVCDLPANN